MIEIIELELENFKSFHKKTKIPFKSGFNVIVGLNGTGKSNIISAIKFVLIPNEFDSNVRYITYSEKYTKVSAKIKTKENKIKKITKFSDGVNFKYYIDDKEVTLSEYKSTIALFQVSGTRLIDSIDFLNMDNSIEKEILKASKLNQFIVVSLKNLKSIDETIEVLKDEDKYSKIKVVENKI